MAVRWIGHGVQGLIGVTAIVAAGIALTGARVDGQDDAAQRRLRLAMQAYEAQEWPRAYAQLSAAADAGDAHAAAVAAMMVRQGPALFGQRFDASPERLARWDGTRRDESIAVAAVSIASRGGNSRSDLRMARAH